MSPPATSKQPFESSNSCSLTCFSPSAVGPAMRPTFEVVPLTWLQSKPPAASLATTTCLLLLPSSAG
jgi:hypothetical protein